MIQEGADQKVSSNRISTFLLFATVAAAPLPYGSTNPSVIAFWCIVLGIAAIAASPRGLRGGQFVLLGLAAIVFAAYGLVLHEQLAAHPWFAAPYPLWRETSEALGTPIEPSVSIARHQPFFALGASLADMLALICSFIICTDRNRARQLLNVVAWSGAAYAIYGIAAFLINPSMILWREKPADSDMLTSTFVNRNIAAVFFGSCAIVWLLLLCERIRGQFPIGSIQWRKVLSGLFSEMPAAVVVSFSMLLVCLAAMFTDRLPCRHSPFADHARYCGCRIILPRPAASKRSVCGFGRGRRRRVGPAPGHGVSGQRALALTGPWRPGAPDNLPINMAYDPRPSMVRNGAWNLCVEFSRLPKRKCFDVGHLGFGAQHAP